MKGPRKRSDKDDLNFEASFETSGKVSTLGYQPDVWKSWS